MKISTTGSAASTTPAQNGPHSCPNWSEMKPNSPTESVYFSGAWSRVDAMMYSFSVDDERQEADDGQHRSRKWQHDAPEDLGRRRPVDARGLVELDRDRVEEADEQPGVDPECAAEIDEHQPGPGVQPHAGEHVADLEHDQVDRDDGEELREHLDQEEREHPAAPPAEPEPREGVGRECAEQNREDRRRGRDDHRVQVPVGIRLGFVREDRAEVVQRDPLRDDRRRAERRHRVERGRDDVDDGEEGERHGDEPDEVAPPHVAERGPVGPRRLQHEPLRGGLGLVEPCDDGSAFGTRGHWTFSSAFVRVNEINEIAAMRRKMMIERAEASP